MCSKMSSFWLPHFYLDLPRLEPVRHLHDNESVLTDRPAFACGGKLGRAPARQGDAGGGHALRRSLRAHREDEIAGRRTVAALGRTNVDRRGDSGAGGTMRLEPAPCERAS